MVISRGGTVEVNTGQTSAVNRGDVLALPLEIRNIPSLGTGNGIGAFTFDLTWDKNVVTVSSLTAATITGWTINTGTIDSVNGTVRITGYTANSYFTANVTIATLNLSATGALGSSTPVGVTVVSLGDKDSNAVGAAAVSATVRIINPLAETSIAPFTDTDSVVTVSVNINRVKDRLDGRTSVVPGGIGAYSATAACAPASGIEYVAVREVAPYVDPVFNATTGIFAVFSVASPMQPSNSTVARLVPKLVGDCNTSYTLTVSF
jgi:hypothetical protein